MVILQHRAGNGKRPSPIRGGGTRTPDLRFWRPPLYQLSYAPRLETSSVSAPLAPECNVAGFSDRAVGGGYSSLLAGK